MKDIACIIPRSLSHESSTLRDLPSEILSEIASHLDFVDILSLQQTCRRLRESTDTHVVWLRLAGRYSARHFYHYRPETGTIDSLRTDELRAWIRKRLVIDQVWRTRGVRPRFRVIPGPTKDWNTFSKLVPGGRWLLVGYRTGHTDYYDLDSNVPKPVSLIQPSKNTPGFFDGKNEPAVHVDQDALRLEFKLAIYARGDNPFIETGRGWTHIWQVRSEDGSSLIAEWLTSIPCRNALPVTLCLERNLMTCTMTPVFGSSWIDVFWWEQCSVTRVLRASFSIHNGRSKIFLIGEDRLLRIGVKGAVELYNIPEPEYTGVEGLTSQLDIPSREPIWSHSFSSNEVVYSSPLFHDAATHRLVVSTDSGIWGLVLPKMSDDPPSIIQLSKFTSRWGVCIPGICKAYAFYGKNRSGVRVGYGWDDGSGVPAMGYTTGKRKRDVSLDGVHPAFDEEGGRFVYFTGGNTVVVDFLRQLDITS